jgi:hypothetical protein
MNRNSINGAGPARLDLARTGHAAWRWLTAAVLVHLVVSIVHGTAHSGAQVPLSRAANLFVFGVIIAGPLVGLALAWPAARIGSWVIAITMAGAFVFGCVNHFVLAGPDHVSEVAPQWRTMFATTAALLAALEVFASVLAIVSLAEERSL